MILINQVGILSQRRVLADILMDPREADKREWETAGWNCPFEVSLKQAIEGDMVWEACATYPQFKTLLAFGVIPHARLWDVGKVWLVATNAAVLHYRDLRRVYFEGLMLMLEFFPTLHAWADSRNTLHHRWMEVMGFKRTDKVVLLGEREDPFFLFTYNKSDNKEQI